MTHKLSLTIRIKMWLDYFKYLIFLQQGESIRVLMGFLIFLLSVYLVEHELTSNFAKGHGEDAINLIIYLIIVKFLWEIYSTQSEIRSYFHIQRSILRNNLTKPTVLPDEKEMESGFKAVEIPGSKADLIFVSEKVNNLIQTTSLPITLSGNKNKHIKNYILTHREILLQYLNHYFFNSLYHHRQFTNDKKLCLSKDILANSTKVICHIGGYYDSFLTNQVSSTTLVIKDKVHTTITTEHIFPSRQDDTGQRYLNDISSSQMNDHLGCSTIAFTKDNYLLIWVQGSNTQFNKDMLIPTGSGSANQSDISHHNLQKTVIKTMERELMEETLSAKSVDNSLNKTLILGYYRWVTRGGKPEFTGITKMSGNAQDYRPDPLENRTDKQSVLKFKINSIDDIPEVIKQIQEKGRLSTPLYMCLYQLKMSFENNKKMLQEFLF